MRYDQRPISHSELCAYFRLAGVDPLPVEFEAIRLLDREWSLHKANTVKRGK